LSEVKHRPKWLRVDRLSGEHGIVQDTPAQEKVGLNHPGATRKEAAHERAEAIIAKELRRKGWCEGELARHNLEYF
jgi:hypothetical protein